MFEEDLPRDPCLEDYWPKNPPIWAAHTRTPSMLYTSDIMLPHTQPFPPTYPKLNKRNHFIINEKFTANKRNLITVLLKCVEKRRIMGIEIYASEFTRKGDSHPTLRQFSFTKNLSIKESWGIRFQSLLLFTLDR